MMTISKPILFKDRLVLKLLSGVKTQTRRLPRNQPVWIDALGEFRWPGDQVRKKRKLIQTKMLTHSEELARCKVQPGCELWVREAWRTEELESGVGGVRCRADGSFHPIPNTAEAADSWVQVHNNGIHGKNWRPSIFMPRWASRLTLSVNNVRLEQVQEIGEGDARAEGVQPPSSEECERWMEQTLSSGEPVFESPYRSAFAILWDKINGQRGGLWVNNPFVWVYEFEKKAP